MENLREKKVVERIKNNYTEKTHEQTKFEELKALDRKVKAPANVFAYIYGIVGALILGTGMCLAMKIIGNIMPLGVVIGILGIAMVSTCYPIYKSLLNNRKAQYSGEILERSNQLLNK